jgi:halogenation protein CepH
MSETRAVDVAVIGGGPAGSTTAALLARRGFEVLLLEREVFPRDHVGESLLPATLQVLDEIGVLGAVEAEGFVKKWGATMVWGRESEPWSWYFKETNRTYPHAYQVWRPRFDEILLDHAKKEGAQVAQGADVKRVLREGQRVCGLGYTSAEGADHQVAARMVVDASGQAAFLAREFHLREWDPFFRNLAVYGYFEGADRLPHPDQGNIFLESYENGWMWTIPLNAGLSSVGAVVDREFGATGIRDRGLERFFEEQIAATARTCELLGPATRAKGPVAARDWSYCAKRFVGDGYVLVGDAACFVDPLFSTGVHLAVSAGYLAAAYVDAGLRDASIMAAAGSAYANLYRTQYRHFHQLAKLFYSGNRTVESYFWDARRLVGGDERFTPREAFVNAVSGQAPQGYERSVLAKGVLPPEFVVSVDSTEREREERRRFVTSLDDPASLIPRLDADVSLERCAVLASGTFEWGLAFRRPRRDDVACSAVVAAFCTRAHGSASIAEIAQSLAAQYGADVRELEALLVDAATILHCDALLDLRTPDS